MVAKNCSCVNCLIQHFTQIIAYVINYKKMQNCSICLGVRLSKSISKKSSKSTHTVSITVSKNAQNVKTITKQLAKRTNCAGSVLQTDRSSSALSSFSLSLLVNPSCISANCAALSAAPAAIIMVL